MKDKMEYIIDCIQSQSDFSLLNKHRRMRNRVAIDLNSFSSCITHRFASEEPTTNIVQTNKQKSLMQRKIMYER